MVCFDGDPLNQVARSEPFYFVVALLPQGSKSEDDLLPLNYNPKLLDASGQEHVKMNLFQQCLSLLFDFIVPLCKFLLPLYPLLFKLHLSLLRQRKFLVSFTVLKFQMVHLVPLLGGADVDLDCVF